MLPEWENGEAELAALRKAYGSGVTSIRIGDIEVRYDSGEAMLRRIRELEKAVNPAPTGGNSGSTIRTQFCRGS